MKHKKGGIVTGTVMGIAGLVIGVIIAFVIINTLSDANLFGSGAINHSLPLTQNEQIRESVGNMTGNFTQGIGNISSKLPTILLIVAVVFLFGAIVLLVRQSGAMGIGGKGGSL